MPSSITDLVERRAIAAETLRLATMEFDYRPSQDTYDAMQRAEEDHRIATRIAAEAGAPPASAPQ